MLLINEISFAVCTFFFFAFSLLSLFFSLSVCVDVWCFFCWFGMISWRVLTVKIEFTFDEMMRKKNSFMFSSRRNVWVSVQKYHDYAAYEIYGIDYGTLWSLAIRSHRMELNLIWIYQAFVSLFFLLDFQQDAKRWRKKARAHTHRNVYSTCITANNVEQYLSRWARKKVLNLMFKYTIMCSMFVGMCVFTSKRHIYESKIHENLWQTIVCAFSCGERERVEKSNQ